MPESMTVHAEREGRVMVVRLDNPPHNFMTGEMVGELDALVRLVEEDATVGAVVITGAPDDVFITHFDVAEILRGSGVATRALVGPASGGLRAVGALRWLPGSDEALSRTPAAGIVGLLAIHDLFNRMNRTDKVFVAAINGLALGGGFELALACDIRIMADGGLPIGLPETTIGLIPGAGGTQRLTHLLGAGRALELMLEGRPVLAEEALALGLVSRVVKPDALMDEAFATAARLARRSPSAVKQLKRAVYQGARRPFPDGLQIERAAFVNASSSPEAQRAMVAYLDEIERVGDAGPHETLRTLEAFRDGTAVDTTGEG